VTSIVQLDIVHARAGPCSPRADGKVERGSRTLTARAAVATEPPSPRQAQPAR